MRDDFLDDLKRNWREQDAEVEVVARRLKLSVLVQRVMLWLENGVGVLSPFFGLWALWHGAQMQSGFVIIGALSVIVTGPLFAWLAWRTRRAEPRWSDDTPEGVLRQMVERTRTTERLMRIVRWQGWMLIGISALLWTVTPTGFVDSDERQVFVTAFFFASALIAFGWSVWRVRGARRERGRCERLLEDFR